jgi:hypothetical protein
MAGYPVHRSANPWHGHRPLRRANIHPSVTIGHSVHNADSGALGVASLPGAWRALSVRFWTAAYRVHSSQMRARLLRLAFPFRKRLVVPPTPGLHFPNAVIRGLPQIRLVIGKIQLPQLMLEQRADVLKRSPDVPGRPANAGCAGQERFRSGR